MASYRRVRFLRRMFSLLVVCLFFFQAEDGIRDVAVTGVQTCALPISCAEERFRLRQHLVGAQRGSMEILHRFPSHAGLKRRSVRLFNTTLRLDHAIAALANTGESSTWSHGYNAPAATGMPITL